VLSARAQESKLDDGLKAVAQDYRDYVLSDETPSDRLGDAQKTHKRLSGKSSKCVE